MIRQAASSQWQEICVVASCTYKTFIKIYCTASYRFMKGIVTALMSLIQMRFFIIVRYTSEVYRA